MGNCISMWCMITSVWFIIINRHQHQFGSRRHPDITLQSCQRDLLACTCVHLARDSGNVLTLLRLTCTINKARTYTNITYTWRQYQIVTCSYCTRVRYTLKCFLVNDLHTKWSPTQSDIFQMLYWYNWFSWWWARGCSKHVEIWNKHTEKNFASSWSFTKNHNKWTVHKIWNPEVCR
jgi:hypothetical protein